MKTLRYEQIWEMSSWLEISVDHGENVIGEIFKSVPAIAWLLENDFAPTVTRHQDVYLQNIRFIMQFELADEIVTFLLVKWPDEVEKIDFDSMITIIGTTI